MALLPILGGAYEARSVIAGAQRSVNLYPESNPPDSQAPVPITHYLTPGLKRLGTPATIAGWRATYQATDGTGWGIVGPNVYFIDSLFGLTLVGVIPDSPNRPSFSDNGSVIVLVDGTPLGYAIDMASHTFGQINDAAFYGADKADFLDTFFIFNRPGTAQFYISLSNVSYGMLIGGAAFDPLDIAAKTGGADPIVTLIVVHRQLWLIGSLTAEVWTDTGAADFTFGAIPGAFTDHGCVAKYSVVSMDNAAYWLTQDRQGQGIIVKTNDVYGLEAISTFVIDADIQSYNVITNAIGGAYQQQGHAFYVIAFPSADKTWQREVSTGKWNEWASLDNNGKLHRHRSSTWAFLYGKNVVGDFSNGKLYALDPTVYNDDGVPIVRIRSVPHIVNNGKRFEVNRLQADMEVGNPEGTLNKGYAGTDFNPDFNSDFGPLFAPDTIPKITLRISMTRGASWLEPLLQDMGAGGDYLTSISWTRLGGNFRDAIFELSWSGDFKTALNGIFLETTGQGT